MSDELVWRSATELTRMVRDREASPVEIMTAVLERAEAVQAACNAFVTIDGDGAMARARKAEAAVMSGEALGPLHGVPVSVKDLCNTASIRTTFGSLAYKDNVPAADCVAVARLTVAGAIVSQRPRRPNSGISR